MKMKNIEISLQKEQIQWYYKDNWNQKCGPIDENVIADWFQNQLIDPYTLIGKTRESNYFPIKNYFFEKYQKNNKFFNSFYSLKENNNDKLKMFLNTYD